MAVPVAVVDANVLYSIELTDLLLTLGTRRLVRLHWSPAILDEVRRNLALRPDLSAEAIDYRLDRMNLALPGALDEAPPALVESMPVNHKDRHVLALAVHVEAGTLVTFNLRDFPPAACEAYGIEARSPDDFLTTVADADVIGVRGALAAMAGRRSRPPMSVDQVLDRLARELPSFERRVRLA
ncbi:MAG: PIN domain-containing protein [Acidimicrobiales bacterium]